MSFYDLSKKDRNIRSEQIRKEINSDFRSNKTEALIRYFSDPDTYIRKAGYLAVGRIYKADKALHKKILDTIEILMMHPEAAVRQTTLNAAGEIGTLDFEVVTLFFDKGLFDEHHAVRNAVIGSVKKMGEKNPGPVLHWARKYLHHEDKEIRREICHGIELRGRTHPEDILDMLQELEFDETPRVSKTLVHVIGQISYKTNCLTTVIAHLNGWNNREIVAKCVAEIIDVHDRYKNFAVLTQAEAIEYIDNNLPT